MFSCGENGENGVCKCDGYCSVNCYKCTYEYCYKDSLESMKERYERQRNLTCSDCGEHYNIYKECSLSPTFVDYKNHVCKEKDSVLKK